MFVPILRVGIPNDLTACMNILQAYDFGAMTINTQRKVLIANLEIHFYKTYLIMMIHFTGESDLGIHVEETTNTLLRRLFKLAVHYFYAS